MSDCITIEALSKFWLAWLAIIAICLPAVLAGPRGGLIRNSENGRRP